MSTTTASSSSTARNWLDLPADVTAKILMKLGAIDILANAQKVCVSWWRICKDSSMWRRIDFCVPRKHRPPAYDFEKICRHAVDRSDGQLIEIRIKDYATDELLQYIAQRSSSLKCLRLVMCNISDEGLIKVVAKLPFLEELELTFCTVTEMSLKAVGKSCRLLNSVKFNRLVRTFPGEASDNEALAIAENMPGLCHLQLVGSKITYNGLQTIISGCPHLESLDLRLCYHLFAKRGLVKACVDHIKSVKLPMSI